VTLAPGVQRRRELRQHRRVERLRNLWRILVFSAMAAGLGYALLRYGWVLTTAQQVEVVGSRLVSREQVIKAASLRFPTPLLSLHPRRIASVLGTSLPVEQVQVSRLMAPPRLRVALVDREAVAQAQRFTAKGSENGYVDRLGNWMSSRQTEGLTGRRPLPFRVVGWQPNHRGALALVLSQRERFEGDLRDVRFAPDGTLWIRSARLGPIRLGVPDHQLSRRLDVLQHLITKLPGQLKGQALQSIDLSDPDQPELSLLKPSKPAKPSGSGTAQPLGRD
jgi:cell division protein FtsQ